jgi:hypothetical protein
MRWSCHTLVVKMESGNHHNRVATIEGLEETLLETKGPSTATESLCVALKKVSCLIMSFDILFVHLRTWGRM